MRTKSWKTVSGKKAKVIGTLAEQATAADELDSVNDEVAAFLTDEYIDGLRTKIAKQKKALENNQDTLVEILAERSRLDESAPSPAEASTDGESVEVELEGPILAGPIPALRIEVTR